MRADLSGLSKSDLVSLLELADRSRRCTSHTHTKHLLSDLSHVVPTTGIVAGLVPTTPSPAVLEEGAFINIGYPEEWLKEYRLRNYFFCDPIKRCQWQGADWQIWSHTFAHVASEREQSFIHHAREYGIEEGVTVGTFNATTPRVSFFSFIGPALPETRRHTTILRYLCPFLHEAMARSDAPTQLPESVSPLSFREKEVLRWAMVGKTNWEISMILRISERTVKFHVHNVKKKLDASTRAHAVAIALGSGAIQP